MMSSQSISYHHLPADEGATISSQKHSSFENQAIVSTNSDHPGWTWLKIATLIGSQAILALLFLVTFWTTQPLTLQKCLQQTSSYCEFLLW
jgi:hypothetical protein